MLSTTAAYIGHRLKIMPIVSFLITGAIIGPHALGLVHDEALIQAMAEIGVILLLFTIGIEFSLEKLARIKRIIFLGGSLQVGLVVVLVAGALLAFGVEWRIGIYTGCLVALSSTAIIMKLLMSGGGMSTDEGQVALGMLIFQDLAVVAMVLLVPMLGLGGGSGADVAFALAKAVGIVLVVLIAARRLMPVVLEAVARTCSQEIFLLTIVAICFGTAYVTSLAGVSLSLGAFLAGLVVSESKFSQVAIGEILPLQILFSAAFFLSVGLMFDVGFLANNLLLVLGVVGGVLLIKIVTTGISARLLGYGTGSAMCSALILAQVGEFSFVLERSGRAAGLYPAGLENGGAEAFIAATVALMLATPFLYRLSERLRRSMPATTRGMPSAQAAGGGHGDALADHVIIAGLGPVGHGLARVLHDQAVAYVVVTLSPDGAREAEAGNLRVVRGNYTRLHELTMVGLKEARAFVIADDDAMTTERVVEAIRALNPQLPIIARVQLPEEAERLLATGATEVVVENDEAAVPALSDALRATSAVNRGTPGTGQPAEVVKPRASGSPESIGLTERQLASKCQHVAETMGVRPSSDGCGECLETGDSWVHLRLCMTCGHVGCCDSSPNKHASKHYDATSHPVMRSFEPGEDWAWCYVDRAFL